MGDPSTQLSGGNAVAWEPSMDPAVSPYGTYVVEYAPAVSGPWTVLVQLSATLSGSNYLSGVNRFVYRDFANPYNTWYRVIDMDVQGHLAAPSDPFQTHEMPYFVPGSTPFGIFDNDAQFVGDADRVVDFVKKKLGEPVLTVHMGASQIYAAFEEACLEYSSMVNSYQAKSVLSNYLGSPTGSLTGGESQYVAKNLSFEIYTADPFAGEANLNSMQPWYTGSIQLVSGQQGYDLSSNLRGGPGLTGTMDQARIRIRDLYYRSPLQANRFFGTTSGLNYLNNQFRFESFTPETLFYLLPIWEDVLRGMQFKTSNNVRRSNYSFDIHNNLLRIFPVPSSNLTLWLTYTVDNTPIASTSGTQSSAILPGYGGAVSNLSNVPFGNIMYSNINSISRHWIRRMTLAFAKEIEGQIRSKFSTIPIPNGDVTLNGPEMIADARGEQDILRTELKDLLEDTTYQSLMRKEQEMASYLNDALKNVPMGIYIG